MSLSKGRSSAQQRQKKTVLRQAQHKRKGKRTAASPSRMIEIMHRLRDRGADPRRPPQILEAGAAHRARGRSEEHTSELQSLMRISYAVFCLKKKKNITTTNNINNTQ